MGLPGEAVESGIFRGWHVSGSDCLKKWACGSSAASPTCCSTERRHIPGMSGGLWRPCQVSQCIPSKALKHCGKKVFIYIQHILKCCLNKYFLTSFQQNPLLLQKLLSYFFYPANLPYLCHVSEPYKHQNYFKNKINILTQQTQGNTEWISFRTDMSEEQQSRVNICLWKTGRIVRVWTETGLGLGFGEWVWTKPQHKGSADKDSWRSLLTVFLCWISPRLNVQSNSWQKKTDVSSLL